MIQQFNPQHKISVIKYDGSKGAIESAKKLCAEASWREVIYEAKTKMIMDKVEALTISVEHCDDGHNSTSYVYKPNDGHYQYIVYDENKKWERKIVVCASGYLYTEYGINSEDVETASENTNIIGDLEDEIKVLKKIIVDSHDIMKTFDEQRAYEFLTNKIQDLKIKI